MATDDRRVWGIHTMDDGLFLRENVIAIGWEDMGDLRAIENSHEAFKEKYIAVYPDVKKGSIATSSDMLYRFVYEISIGDYIVFPSKIDRRITLGIVEGDYFYSDKADRYPQRRKVKWLKHLPRTASTQGALYEIGSALSLFMVKNYADEFLAALDPGFKQSKAVDEAEDETVGATAEKSLKARRTLS